MRAVCGSPSHPFSVTWGPLLPSVVPGGAAVSRVPLLQKITGFLGQFILRIAALRQPRAIRCPLNLTSVGNSAHGEKHEYQHSNLQITSNCNIVEQIATECLHTAQLHFEHFAMLVFLQPFLLSGEGLMEHVTVQRSLPEGDGWCVVTRPCSRPAELICPALAPRTLWRSSMRDFMDSSQMFFKQRPSNGRL